MKAIGSKRESDPVIGQGDAQQNDAEVVEDLDIILDLSGQKVNKKINSDMITIFLCIARG
jgi:hypothetical protein